MRQRSQRPIPDTATDPVQAHLAELRRRLVEAQYQYEAEHDPIALVRCLMHIQGELRVVHQRLLLRHLHRLINDKGKFVGTRDQLVQVVKEMSRR